MPLSACPDCAGTVSPVAHACPHCGRPFRAAPATTVSTITWGVFLGMLCFSLLPVVGMIFFAGVLGALVSR